MAMKLLNIGHQFLRKVSLQSETQVYVAYQIV